MSEQRCRRQFRRWLAFAIALGLLLVATTAVAQQKMVETPDAAKYAGSDTCKTCHENIYKKSFENTPHFKTTLDEGHGCESCHGPGAAHVAGGGDVSKIISFKKLSRQESSKRCLSCHGESHEQSRFAESAHAGNDVGCVDCHSPHHAKEEEHLLVQSQPQLCYGCHVSAKADFGKPYHHRVNEGLVQCSDCHNVHGTGTVRQVRTLPGGDAICYKCHADKQGPFVYEHVSGENRRVQQLPHATRFHQPATLAGEPDQLTLPAVPHPADSEPDRAGTQPVAEVSSLHHVP
jgi:DmsE family decaheme c-type cytochrome